MQRLGLLILSAALVVGSVAASAQERFNSSEDAVTALVDAAKAEDQKALLKVLGPKGQQIVSSGDPVADRAAREKFVTAYGTKHSITRDSLDQATLVIGDDDWPFPIPLVRKHDSWQFDTGAGLDEILRRRIGRTSSPRSKSCSLMSRRRTNMPRSILTVSARMCMRSAS